MDYVLVVVLFYKGLVGQPNVIVAHYPDAATCWCQASQRWFPPLQRWAERETRAGRSAQFAFNCRPRLTPEQVFLPQWGSR